MGDDRSACNSISDDAAEQVCKVLVYPRNLVFPAGQYLRCSSRLGDLAESNAHWASYCAAVTRRRSLGVGTRSPKTVLRQDCVDMVAAILLVDAGLSEGASAELGDGDDLYDASGGSTASMQSVSSLEEFKDA